MPNVAFRRRQKIRVAKTLLVLVGLLFFQSAFAKPNQVSDIRVWMAPDHTRIVFDLQGPAEYRVFSLEQPNRLVVDLENVVLKSTRLPVIKESSSVKGMRYAIRNKNDLRIVLDLDAIPKKIKHFKLEPNREYGHRVLVELLGEEETIQEIVVPPPKTNGQAAAQQEQQQRDIVVAIDAGHGGEDPGARGKKGTKEKEVVLSIAKKLADRVNKQEGMKAVLVRGGDYYISLRKRIAIARKHKADLFVSIHADAYNNPRVKGSSVYILSSRGASGEAARWLAAKENAADLIGGVSLDDKDDVLASVLLDLSLSGTIDVSNQIAGKLLTEIKKVGPVHSHKVQQAGFVVLKSPDIPSVLVETAFISNPSEERRLRDPGYQARLASALFSGIKRYFEHNPPPGTLLASTVTTHTVKQGETLSDLARRYRVSLEKLSASNQLKGNMINAGQVLFIPTLQ